MVKALFIVDSYSWALANRARNLKSAYSKHSIIIKHFNELDNFDFNSFDLVYSLNWPIHGYIKNKITPNKRYRLVTTISSHIGRGHAKTLSGILNKYDAISTSNMLLFNEFKGVYSSKVFYTPFGVNTKLFVPKNNPKRYANIFGWVGNHNRSVKRFKEIKKAFKNLGSEYTLKTAFAGDNLSRKQMVEFYNSIGTLICFSSSEGTPNPILEAGACGRAVISTRVGNVPELNKRTKSIIIVSNRLELERAIKNIKLNESRLEKNGLALKKEIHKGWSWDNQARLFKPFLRL